MCRVSRNVAFFVSSIFLLLTACSDKRMVFTPYDYQKQKKAKVESRDGRNSVKIDTDELIMRRKIPFPWLGGE